MSRLVLRRVIRVSQGTLDELEKSRRPKSLAELFPMAEIPRVPGELPSFDVRLPKLPPVTVDMQGLNEVIR
jgi:hypothetical protein